MIINKCIRQNWKIFNKIRFEPLGFELHFNEPIESQQWSENKWNYLISTDMKRECIYVNKSKTNKYTITLWNDGEYLYLIQVVRTEYNSDDTLVYIAPLTEDNLSDLKTISKFIHKNIKSIINNSIDGVHEIDKLATLNTENKPDGIA